MNLLGTQTMFLEGQLTDLFYTEAFAGSWEVFSKFNWLGYFMQFFISAICLLALFLIAYQRLMTLFYLAARPLFDRVHEIKQQGRGQKFLGLPALASNTLMTANHGTGLDAIVSFLLSLLPDVKAYSDYNEERRSYNLQDDDTCTTYILKTAIPTIMLIFFFSMGFNGTLFKAYGTVVDAMGTAADNVVTADLSSQVQKWMNNGSAYQFTFDAEGTEHGDLKQRVAKDMYSKVLRKSSNLSTETKLYIGRCIENYIIDNFNSLEEGAIGDVTIVGFDGTDADCKNIMYTVAINATESYGDTSEGELSGKGIPVSEFGVKNEGITQYVHVRFSKKANSTDEKNYFQDNREEAAEAMQDGNSGGGKNSGKQDKPTGQQ